MGVDLRQDFGQGGDILRCASARHHILALRVDEVLAEKCPVARGRVAGEKDPCTGVVAKIAKDHGHDVDGGAHVVRDAPGVAVRYSPRTVPTAEHGVNGPLQLLPRVLGDIHPHLTLHRLLKVGDDAAQLVDAQVLVLSSASGGLVVVQNLIEDLAVDAQYDAPIHVDEAAVGIGGDPLVVHQPGQSVYCLIVDAEVQDGIHHSWHGYWGPGAHRHQQGGLAGAEPTACRAFHMRHVRLDVVPQAVGKAPASVIVSAAGLGGDDEAGRHRQTQPGHFAQVRSLAAQQLAHAGVALVESVHHLAGLGHAGPPFLSCSA